MSLFLYVCHGWYIINTSAIYYTYTSTWLTHWKRVSRRKLKYNSRRKKCNKILKKRHFTSWLDVDVTGGLPSNHLKMCIPEWLDGLNTSIVSGQQTRTFGHDCWQSTTEKKKTWALQMKTSLHNNLQIIHIPTSRPATYSTSVLCGVNFLNWDSLRTSYT